VIARPPASATRSGSYVNAQNRSAGPFRPAHFSWPARAKVVPLGDLRRTLKLGRPNLGGRVKAAFPRLGLLAGSAPPIISSSRTASHTLSAQTGMATPCLSWFSKVRGDSHPPAALGAAACEQSLCRAARLAT